METAPSHREEDELDHHQAKEPHGLWEGQAHGVEKLLFWGRVPSITVMKLPNTVPLPALEPATPAVAAPAPGNLAAVSESFEVALVWKLWLGIHEMVWGSGAAKLLWLSSVSVSSPSPLQTVMTQQGGGSPDQGEGRDEFGTGVHFQGMKAKGPRAAPHADKTEGQGGGSPWTSFKFSLGAFCQRIFNVLCIT